ncbi:AAA family ATPase [Clostridium thermarum]|uniref:AAA family ATPase n=1 Tax=Clostridium thermarum TaxID=1716543 RepID=UPI003C2CA4A2
MIEIDRSKENEKHQAKKLLLKNFKGDRALEVNFSSCTNIYGDNGTGKTTIYLTLYLAAL